MLHLKGCCRGKAFVEAASVSKYVARIIVQKFTLNTTFSLFYLNIKYLK